MLQSGFGLPSVSRISLCVGACCMYVSQACIAYCVVCCLLSPNCRLGEESESRNENEAFSFRGLWCWAWLHNKGNIISLDLPRNILLLNSDPFHVHASALWCDFLRRGKVRNICTTRTYMSWAVWRDRRVNKHTVSISMYTDFRIRLRLPETYVYVCFPIKSRCGRYYLPSRSCSWARVTAQYDLCESNGVIRRGSLTG